MEKEKKVLIYREKIGRLGVLVEDHPRHHRLDSLVQRLNRVVAKQLFLIKRT